MDRYTLQRAGLRVTPTRLEVLQLLAEVPGRHWSPEAIHQTLLERQGKSTLSTVYRVLTDLENVDLVKRHHFYGEGSVFEVNRLTHDHLICEKCGEVVEFNDAQLEQRLKDIAQNLGFQLTERALHLRGRCKPERCKSLQCNPSSSPP